MTGIVIHGPYKGNWQLLLLQIEHQEMGSKSAGSVFCLVGFGLVYPNKLSGREKNAEAFHINHFLYVYV